MRYKETVHFKTTTEQLELIDNIARHYEKSRSETIRDMISMFVLITETNITLRDIIITAAPTLAERLIENDIETAVAIFGKPDPVTTGSDT